MRSLCVTLKQFELRIPSYLCVDATEEIVLVVWKLEQLCLQAPAIAVLGAVGREQQETISLISGVEHKYETRYVLKKQTVAMISYNSSIFDSLKELGVITKAMRL